MYRTDITEWMCLIKIWTASIRTLILWFNHRLLLLKNSDNITLVSRNYTFIWTYMHIRNVKETSFMEIRCKMVKVRLRLNYSQKCYLWTAFSSITKTARSMKSIWLWKTKIKHWPKRGVEELCFKNSLSRFIPIRCNAGILAVLT